MVTSENGIALIKKYEGFYSSPYWDVDGYSIGYGHHENVKKTDRITRTEADNLLRSDLSNKYEKYVNKYMRTYNFTQNEYDALISFVYNTGNGNLNKLLDNGKRSKKEIAEKIVLYNKAGGKRVQGLANRRKEEQKLFLLDTPKKKTEYYKKYTGVSNKIDIVFKEIGALYGNVSKRKPVAKANGFTDYTGLASENLYLIKLAKNGLLRK